MQSRDDGVFMMRTRSAQGWDGETRCWRGGGLFLPGGAAGLLCALIRQRRFKESLYQKKKTIPHNSGTKHRPPPCPPQPT